MHILLVNPPASGRSIPEEQYGVTTIKQIFRGEPFGLETLAGGVPEQEVRILDLKCESQDALWRAIADFRPQVIGFTAVTCEANTVLRLARQVRQTSDAVVVVGGNHASCDPDFFNRGEIDYIVVGVGKKSFRELIEKLQRGDGDAAVPGIARTCPDSRLKYRPRRYCTEDLLEGYPPRYDLVEHYRDHYVVEKLKLKMGFVMTAQGCTHACSFCAIPATTGGKYLLHSPEAVVRDMALLKEIPFIRMVDANTFGIPEASRALSRRIMALPIRKRFIVDVRADTIVRHFDVLKEWKEAGLHGVVVGFEDIQDVRIAGYDKRYRADSISRSIALLHELDLLIVGDFIIPPDYSLEEFTALERFIAASRIQVPVLSILTPIPGTPLYGAMKEKVVVHDLDFYTFTNAVVPTALPEKVFYETFSGLVKRLHGAAAERSPAKEGQ